MLVIMMKQGVQIHQDNDGIKISGGIFYSITVPYSEIEDVKITDGMVYGSRTNGAAIFSYHVGNYRNSTYGSYKLFVNSEIAKYIVIQYDHGKTVVFNCKNEETTQGEYESILERIGDNGIKNNRSTTA